MISTRFHLNPETSAETQAKLCQIASLSADFNTNNKNATYLEFKNKAHLMAFPDEFMPEIFLQEIKKHSKNVTMKVSYCPGFAQSGPIVWERDKALGSSAISYESGEIYAKGTGFKSLLSILKIFINSRGNISYLKKEKDELEMYKLKLSETEKKYELSLQKESSYKKCIKSFKDTMRQLWQSNDSLIKIIDDYKSLQKSEEIEYTIKNCALFYFSKLRHFLAK